jgi:exo-beta-1,3-glucanase (GH17 family)
MVLSSIDALELNGTVKVWLGVWQANNAATNSRQLEQMYDILNTYGSDPFVGVIVGNEVLFRKDMSASALGTVSILSNTFKLLRLKCTGHFRSEIQSHSSGHQPSRGVF